MELRYMCIPSIFYWEIGALYHEKTWVTLPQREFNTLCGSIGEYYSKGSQHSIRDEW